MKPLNGISTILLDMDGTLTDLSKRWWDPFFRAYYQLNPEADEKHVESEFETAVGPIIETATGDSRFVNFKIFWKVTSIMKLGFVDRVRILKILRQDPLAFKELELLQNSEDTVKQLFERGYKLGMVTSASRETLDLAMTISPVFQLFDKIVTKDDVSRIKPNPEGILMVCDHLQVSVKETVMVGDFPQDILAGKNAGTKTIAVLGKHGQYTHHLLKKTHPDMIIDDISDLLQIFPKVVTQSL